MLHIYILYLCQIVQLINHIREYMPKHCVYILLQEKKGFFVCDIIYQKYYFYIQKETFVLRV